MNTYQEIVSDLSGVKFIQRTNEDGSVTFIPTDPANSDYQAYLNKDTLVPELTEPAPMEKPKK